MVNSGNIYPVIFLYLDIVNSFLVFLLVLILYICSMCFEGHKFISFGLFSITLVK